MTSWWPRRRSRRTWSCPPSTPPRSRSIPRRWRCRARSRRVIANIGAGPAAGPFSVLFFEDRDVNGAFDPGRGPGPGLDQPHRPGRRGLGRGCGRARRDGAVRRATSSTPSWTAAATCRRATRRTTTAAPRRLRVRAAGAGWSPALEWAWTGSAVAADVQQGRRWRRSSSTSPPTGYPRSSSRPAGQQRAAQRAPPSRPRQRRRRALHRHDPAYDLYPPGQLAVGDIDVDGQPEIVAVGESRLDADRVRARRHLQVEEPALGAARHGWGGPALADLDGDGDAEIVIGRQVLNSRRHPALDRVRPGAARTRHQHGRSRSWPTWTWTARRRSWPATRPTARPARSTGRTPRCPTASTRSGTSTTTPSPRSCSWPAGKVWLLEHDRRDQVGAGGIPGGGIGGAPDRRRLRRRRPAARSAWSAPARYVVFETDGTVKWAAPIQDGTSSHRLLGLRLRGGRRGRGRLRATSELLRSTVARTGRSLFQTPHGERAPRGACRDRGRGRRRQRGDRGGHERRLRLGPCRHGIYVFGDANDSWVVTRPIWNQHAYHVTNVNDDGTIPAHEANSWQSFNSYRQNVLTQATPQGRPGCVYAKPDLTASYLRVADARAERRVLTVRIGNGGDAVAGRRAGLVLRRRSRAGGPRLGTVRHVGHAAPGRVRGRRRSPSAARDHARLRLDRGRRRRAGSSGTVAESNEDNNAFDSGRALLAERHGVDLAIDQRRRLGRHRATRQSLTVAGSVSAADPQPGRGGGGGAVRHRLLRGPRRRRGLPGRAWTRPAGQHVASRAWTAAPGRPSTRRSRGSVLFAATSSTATWTAPAWCRRRTRPTTSLAPGSLRVPARRAAFAPRIEWALDHVHDVPEPHERHGACPRSLTWTATPCRRSCSSTFSTATTYFDGRLRALSAAGRPGAVHRRRPRGTGRGLGPPRHRRPRPGDPGGDALPEIVAVQEGGSGSSPSSTRARSNG